MHQRKVHGKHMSLSCIRKKTRDTSFIRGVEERENTMSYTEKKRTANYDFFARGKQALFVRFYFFSARPIKNAWQIIPKCSVKLNFPECNLHKWACLYRALKSLSCTFPRRTTNLCVCRALSFMRTTKYF
jgi:hypothetical protein